MQYKRLGSSGLVVSRIGLGMMSFGDPTEQAWALSESDADPIVQQAVESGIIFFDTADTYSSGMSEEITGRLLQKYFPSRDDYVLASKVYYPVGPGHNARGLSRKHLLSALETSLRRLGTDYVDLYQLHRWDSAVPIDETVTALDDAVRAGKIRYVGASTMAAWQLSKAVYCARSLGAANFTSIQLRYNLVNREPESELLPLCEDLGLGVLTYSPQARGLLAGTHAREGGKFTPRSRADSQAYRAADYDVAEATSQLAEEYGVPPAQIALAWLLSKPAITAPIAGATRQRHLTDAINALDVRLAAEDVRGLEAAYIPHAPGEFT